MRFLIAFLAAALAAAPVRLDREPDDLIAELDRRIQLRFLDGKAFGMRRVIPFAFHGVRDFAPENADEQSVVSRLKDKRYEVALFLAGRGVLASSVPLGVLLPHRIDVQGPAYITPVGAGLPPARSLLEESRRALARFESGGGYVTETDGWTVALRPLRAANGSCLQCHARSGAADLKLGDALGVAIYVYRVR
jgi:hypothetical protein